ncbi:MAG TPA: hypothetical protein PKW95_03795 [bacterium]|nr:hypothetical protein [bacterium]
MPAKIKPSVEFPINPHETMPPKPIAKQVVMSVIARVLKDNRLRIKTRSHRKMPTTIWNVKTFLQPKRMERATEATMAGKEIIAAAHNSVMIRLWRSWLSNCSGSSKLSANIFLFMLFKQSSLARRVLLIGFSTDEGYEKNGKSEKNLEIQRWGKNAKS